MKRITLATVASVMVLGGFDVLADEWSWAGKSGDVTIPSGVVATVADADVEAVEALTGIAVEKGAQLVFQNATKACTLKANLSGAGKVLGALWQSGAWTKLAELKLTGDNVNHTGEMFFSNQVVCVASRHGLGSPTRAVTHYHSGARLYFSGAGLTNDVPIRLNGTRSGVANRLADLNDPLVLNGNVTALAYTAFDWGNWMFNGTLNRSGGNFWQYVVEGYHPVVNGTINLTSGAYLPIQIPANSSYTLNSSGAANGWAYPVAYGSGRFICGSNDVLYAEKSFGVGQKGEKSGTLDLNGTTQTVDCIWHWRHTDAAKRWDPTKGESSFGTVISDRPATVKMTMQSTTDVPNAAIKYSGKVSLRQTGSGTYTLVNVVSDTEGALEVESGVVAFAWNAGWTGPVNVTGGEARFLDGASLNAKKSDVSVSGAGKLYITNGTALACHSLSLGGEACGIGLFSKKTHPDWIDGEGTIEVVPQYVDGGQFVWTGAKNGDLTDDGNWEGGKAPALLGADTLVFRTDASGNRVTVPRNIAVYGLVFETRAPFALVGAKAGTSVSVGPGGVSTRLPSDADASSDPVSTVEVDIIQSMSSNMSWPIAVGTTLHVKGDIIGGTVAQTLTVPAPGGLLKLEGDNSGLLAKLKLYAPTWSMSPTALGHSSRETTLGTNIVKFVGNGLTNDTPLVLAKAMSNLTLDPEDPLVFRQKVQAAAAGAQNLNLGYETTFLGGLGPTGSLVFAGPGGKQAHMYVREKPIVFTSTAYTLFKSTVTLHLDVPNTNQWSYLGCEGTLVCGAENVLLGGSGSSGHVYFGTYYTYGNGTIDLNGYDQTVNKILRYSSGSQPLNVTSKSKEYGTVTSDRPALMKLVTATGLVPEYPLRFMDHAGLEQAGGATNQLVNQKSSTVGPLKVSDGELVLKWAAGFTNVETVVISKGRLKVASDSSDVAFGTDGNHSKAVVTISDGGTLELEGGLVRTAGLVVDGASLAAGYYGSKTCTDSRVPEANKLDALVGDGVVKNGKLGLLLLVR